MKKLKIAVISDLNCHPLGFEINGTKIDDTYLKTDMLRTPSTNHPVESLLDIVDSNNINCDLTLCPGDFTNKSNVQGLIFGWDSCLEISQAIKSQELIGTVGNHDVDSYLNYSNYSFKNVKGIKKNFPFKDSNGNLNIFWSIGCGFIEKDNVRILVINSCHYHHNKVNSISGEVSDELIEYVKKYYKENNDDKINIVMTHHHPIDHSKNDLGEADKIVNSDELLEVLGDNKVDLLIHGHKHHALLRYHICSNTNHKIPVFASGSFSATSNYSYSQHRNHFHIIEISKENGQLAKGTIKTYTFLRRQGWVLNDDPSGFKVYSGFGYQGELKKLVDLVDDNTKEEKTIEWEELVKLAPDIEHLTPGEMDNFEEEIRNRGIIVSSKVLGKPEYVFKLKNK